MPLALIITLSGYASSRSGPNLLPLAAVRASTDLTSAKETVCGSFIHVTRGNGNPAFATAIVVWAADHEGKDALTKREVEAYWKGTSRKLPANTARDIGVTVKSAWLMKGEGNTYGASGYGREAIGLS
jgi:hypothetical protein